MTTLNPRWLSIEMADADATVNKWPVDLKKSFEAAAQNFRRGVESESRSEASDPPDRRRSDS